MIDINQSVKQGDDVIINEGGDQHLGSYEEFNLKAAEGLLTGVHLDGEQAEAILEAQAPAPTRNAQGKFIKVKELDMPDETTPEVTPEVTPEAPVEAPAEATPEVAPEPEVPAEAPAEAPAEPQAPAE